MVISLKHSYRLPTTIYGCGIQCRNNPDSQDARAFLAHALIFSVNQALSEPDTYITGDANEQLGWMLDSVMAVSANVAPSIQQN